MSEPRLVCPVHSRVSVPDGEYLRGLPVYCMKCGNKLKLIDENLHKFNAEQAEDDEEIEFIWMEQECPTQTDEPDKE